MGIDTRSRILTLDSIHHIWKRHLSFHIVIPHFLHVWFREPIWEVPNVNTDIYVNFAILLLVILLLAQSHCGPYHQHKRRAD